MAVNIIRRMNMIFCETPAKIFVTDLTNEEVEVIERFRGLTDCKKKQALEMMNDALRMTEKRQ